VAPGSLRQALANANNGDTINFAVTGTISLFSGELVIGKNVTIRIAKGWKPDQFVNGPLGRFTTKVSLN
jgi:hypothetical protein